MNLFHGIFEINNVHPMFVHFPVALLTTAVAFTLLGLIFRRSDLEAAGKWSLYFGTLGSIAAVITGLVAVQSAPHVEDVHEVILWHQYAGYVILGIAVVTSLWRMRIPDLVQYGKKWLYVGLLVILTIVVAASSDWGAQMVYLHGVGVERPAPQSPGEMIFDLKGLKHTH